MKRSVFALIAAMGIAATVSSSFAADHGHLNVGAVGTSQGDPLDFDNGADFATNSAYVFTLVYTNGGTYSGYYQGNITLTALAATLAHAGPVPGAPALGSRIFAQIVSVTGPSGGSFAFWDAGATVPTISIPSGTTSSNLYRLSENDGSPGTDPYGHIHGRRFTATKPGVYTVTFQAFDLSTNGIGGGPIQSPSALLQVYFQAGVTITSLQKQDEVATVKFGAQLGRNYVLQGSTNIANPAAWANVSDPITGNDAFTTIADASPTNRVQFYRIKDTTP